MEDHSTVHTVGTKDVTVANANANATIDTVVCECQVNSFGEKLATMFSV